MVRKAPARWTYASNTSAKSSCRVAVKGSTTMLVSKALSA